MGNKEIIYEELLTAGFNSAAACGILGNIRYESNFNPEAIGDKGTSYGICQWHASRRTALFKFCADNGYDIEDARPQVRFLVRELNQTWAKRLLAQMKAVPDTEEGAYTVGYLFCTIFERPKNAEITGLKRGKKAQEYFRLLHVSEEDFLPEVGKSYYFIGDKQYRNSYKFAKPYEASPCTITVKKLYLKRAHQILAKGDSVNGYVDMADLRLTK